MFKKIISILAFLVPVIALEAQNVLVSGALVGNGSYPTLTAAFAAINSGAQTNAIINVDIIQNTNEGAASAVLNAGTWTRVTVAPVGGARMIEGATTPGQALIDLNGADRVRFLGLLSGQPALTISNTTVSGNTGTSTLRFGGAAQYNRFEGCVLLGSSVTNAFFQGGTVIFDATTTTGGNSYNCLRRCQVGPGPGGLPSKAVFSMGTSTVVNQTDSIVGCTIYDFFNGAATSAGVLLHENSVNFRVLNNRFYQSGARTKTAASAHADVWVTGYGPTQGHWVNGNRIGGTNATGTGMATYHLAAGATYTPLNLVSALFLTNNTAAYDTITNIEVNCVSTGGVFNPFSAVKAGGRIHFHHNLIGSSATPGAIKINVTNNAFANIGLLQTVGHNGFLLEDNMMGGVEVSDVGGGLAFYGINGYDPYAEFTMINRNQLGFAAAPITISSGHASTSVYMIRAFGDDVVINGNTLAYLTCNAPMGSTISDNFFGILADSDYFTGSFVRDNRVHSIANTHPSTSVKMIGIWADNIARVERNLVHALETFSPNSQITGIACGQGGMVVSNNMIQLGLDRMGNTLTTGQILIGLRNDCCPSWILHNSVYIGGHGVGGAANTYAMSELPVITGVSVRRVFNNIFFNARSNGTGTGRHYAMAAANSAVTHLQSNGNLLAAHGAGGVLGRFSGQDYPSLAAWRTALNQDLNSISSDPRFIQPAGSAQTVNLHVVTPPLVTPIEGAGQASNTENYDFDLDQRFQLSPVDIGADAGNFGLEPLPAGPEVELQGNGVVIADGDSIPTAADNTDFGNTGCSVQSSGVFVVLNAGQSPLSISNFSLNGNAAFVLTPPTTTTLSPGQSTHFTVAFNPTLNVPAQATISFTTNDPDEGSYSFLVEGYLSLDNTPPQAVCQPRTVALGTNGLGALDTLAAAALSYDNCGPVSSTFSATQFTCSQLGLQNVTLQVTDTAGNADTCALQVNVIDAIAPQALCQPITLQLNASGTAPLLAAAINASSTDNCAVATLSLSQTSFTCANLGTNTVTLTAADASGNSGTCTAVVTVTDAIAPTAVCQNITVNLNASGTATVTAAAVDNGSNDNCSIATRAISQAQFSCADVGVRPIVLTVTDPSGNAATCSTQVTVQDAVAPVLTCANLTLTVPSSGVATLTPGMVGSATDACGIASYQLSQTQFGCQQVGTSPVRLIAIDANGNADTCIVVLTAVTAPLALAVNAGSTGPCGYHIACAGQSTASASASASGACAPYTYAWSNGQAGASATGLGAGTHSVTVTSANGQQQVQSIQITAPAPIALGMTATSSCSNSPTGSAAVNATGGQSCLAYTYAWSNGDSTTSIAGLAAGTYTVTVTDASGCTSTASTTVGTWPVSSIAITQNLSSLNATPGFATYQWYNSVGAISGATAAQYTPQATGSYFVVATDAFGCEWTSAAFPFTFVALTPAGALTLEARLAPNPNLGVFQLILSRPIDEAVVIHVTDLRGRLVHVEYLASLQSGQQFDLSGLAAGAYFLAVETRLGAPFRLRFVRE